MVNPAVPPPELSVQVRAKPLEPVVAADSPLGADGAASVPDVAVLLKADVPELLKAHTW